jgi:hypothetical protein
MRWMVKATPRPLYPGTNSTGGCMDLAANLQGCGKISHRLSNPEPSSPYRVAKSTTLPRPPPPPIYWGCKKKQRKILIWTLGLRTAVWIREPWSTKHEFRSLLTAFNFSFVHLDDVQWINLAFLSPAVSVSLVNLLFNDTQCHTSYTDDYYDGLETRTEQETASETLLRFHWRR